MSDTDVDPSLDPSSFILREQRSSMAHAMSSLADDPQKAARAVELSDATGDNPTLIYPNLENYEEQHKAALTASLLKSNKFLRQYVDSDPMHAKVSNDDYGNLDSVSEQLKKLSLPMRILRLPEAGGSIFSGAWEGFKKGFGDSPPGSWITDKDLKEHRLGSAVAAVLAMPVEGVLRFGSGILEGAKEGVKEGSATAYKQLTGDEQGAERFSRDLASMVEQHMMGVSGVHAPHVPDVKFSKAAEKIQPIIDKARPWLDESREPPRGLDPEIDKLKFEQNKIDLDNLDEALKAAQGSATRERSPEIFASFIRQHSDASIGISGDAVAKLYGNKVPEIGDNILGWSPRIAEELRTAVVTGGDVQVPLADWLAKVDPEVAKELHDDIRVRPGGITKGEKELELKAKEGLAEPPKPPEIIPEPLPSVRGSAGLEPMFSIGDRKLTLEKRPPRETAEGIIKSDEFRLMDENGKNAGWLEVVPYEGGKRLYIDNVGGFEARGYGPNAFGPALTRDIARQLKAEYPNAEQIGGFRISGAREKAGTTKEVWIKFDELEGPRGWTHVESLRNLFDTSQIDVGKGGILHYTPEFAEYEAQADKIIRDTLAKIAPGAQVFTPSHIEVQGKPSAFRGGFMRPHYEQNPWIVVALDAGDTLGVTRHEAVHYLKQFGFFKEGEWDILTRAARDQDWIRKFNIDKRYPDLDMPRKLEEAIAEGYRNWARGEKVPSHLHPIFERLKELFDSLKIQLKELLGREPTWEELFQKMETGEVGAREPRGHAGGAFLEPSMMEGEEPMFDKAAAIGMTADQFKRYMKHIDQRHTEDLAAAQKRAEAEQGKRLTKEWKDNEKQVRQDVSDSIRQRPDVAADLFFGAGELYGNKVSSRVKIGEGFITPEQKAKLPKDYVSKSGVNPDDFAGVFGYGSGAAMVDRLGEYNEAKMQAGMSAKDYVKRVIDLETQRQMEIKYGSLEKSILDEAKDQAISETQLNLLHEEVLTLGMKAGGEFSITKDDLKRWVKGEFDQTPLRSLDTDKFLASAGKAGKAAEMALLRAHNSGDAELFAEAFRAKQQQYLAMQMATEAKKLEKSIASFDKLAKHLSARDQPSLDSSYVPYIHQILFQIGRQVKRSVQDLQSALAYQGKTLEEFVEAKQQHDLREIPVAEFLLDPAFKKEFENLTAEEFRAVYDSIRSLNANARDELKIYKAGEAADLADIKAQMIDQLRTFKEKFYDAKGGRWMMGVIPPKEAKIIRTYGAAHLQMASLFNRFDRGDPRGVFNQYIMRDLSAAAYGEVALEKKYSRVLDEIGTPKDLNKLVDNTIFKDPISQAGGAEGHLIQFTRKNMLATLLDAGNESNLVKRAKGYGLHREQVTDWLNKHATKEDWDWAQRIWNTFDEIKKESDTMYRSISGVEPEALDIKPIQTPHGTYPGGYYPIIFHPEFEGTSRRLMGGDALEEEGFHRAATPAGYTKKRTAYSAPMSLDLDMLPVRMRQMLHDIAMRPAIINAGKIFYDHDVRAAMAKHYGTEYRDLMIPYLRDVANSANFRDDASRVFTNASEFIRQNMVSTLIGLNPGTVMKHGPTAAINSMTEVGMTNFAKAMTSLMSINEKTGESNWKFAMDNSEVLQSRHRNYSETLSGTTQPLTATSRYESLRQTMIKFAATPVAISDLLSAVPTWLAKYEKEMGEHGIHGDAVYEANRAVERAHGSVIITNRPGVLRTGPMGSWMASVYGFFNHIMNRQYELMWKAGDALDMVKEGNYKDAMKATPELTVMLFSYVLLPALIEEMVTPLATDDKESWGKKAAKGLAYTLGASWVGVRDIASAMLRGQDPAIGLFSTAFKTITDVGRDFSKDKPLSKDHASRVIQHGATLMGTLTGLTNAQMGKTARFGYDVSTGKERPKGPWGWMVGARFGTTEKHSKTFDEWLKHH